jgi:hypothetical protein
VDLERFCGFCFVFPHQDSISEIAGKCYKSYTYAVPMEARRAWLACTVRESEREVAVEVVEELITLRVSLNMLEGATGCCLWPASLFLTEVLLNHPELVSGQKCLEVCCLSYFSSVCMLPCSFLAGNQCCSNKLSEMSSFFEGFFAPHSLLSFMIPLSLYDMEWN